jgi:hypothetical protein
VKNAYADDRLVFMGALARVGTAKMLEIFVQADIPLDEGNERFNYLGAAALASNIDTFDLLLESGASAAKAIPALCRADHDFTGSRVWNQLFSRLVDNSKPYLREFYEDDPFWEVLTNEKALEVRPDAPFAFLQSDVFKPSRLYGSKDEPTWFSYMFQAISRNRVSALEALLVRLCELSPASF